MGGQPVDHTVAPLGRRDPAADVLADLPVQVDQRGVDGQVGALPRGVNQADDGVERFDLVAVSDRKFGFRRSLLWCRLACHRHAPSRVVVLRVRPAAHLRAAHGSG
jgi:hypothetical protein